MSETIEDIKQKELDDYASRIVSQEETIVEEVKEEEQPKLTPEQKEALRSCMKGARPEGMSYELFKSLRTYLKKLNEARLKGNYIHQSIVYTDDKKAIGITYKKDK